MQKSVIDGISTFFVNSREYRNANSEDLDSIHAESSAFPILFHSRGARKAHRHKHTDTHPSTSPPNSICLLIFRHSKLERSSIPSCGCYMHHSSEQVAQELPKVRKGKCRKGMRICSGNQALLEASGVIRGRGQGG